jgi:hypothetical protein
MQIGTGYILSAALHTVAKLRIADLIGDGPPQPVATLAQKAAVSEDGLYRVLRALSMAGIFSEAAPRTFALTPAARLLRADVPGSLRNMAIFMPNPLHFRVYAEMMHSVESGKTASEKVFGMPPFEFLAKNPEESAVFNDAMTSFSAGIIPAVLDAYDFSGINVLADIAGGHGVVLGTILQRYPAMRGILFDQEHVVSGAAPLDALGVRDRVQVVGGDFFASVPSGADAYLMKHIIHDWDDERSEVILRNIHQALAARAGGHGAGRVILLEAVIAAGNDPDFAKVLDLEMLVFPGGRERTEAEFAALLNRSGFELTRIVPTKSPVSVIEARAK